MDSARYIYLAYLVMVQENSGQNIFKIINRDTKKRRLSKESAVANIAERQ